MGSKVTADKSMSTAFMVRINDGLADVLKAWAAMERGKPTPLAAQLLEQAIREAMQSGQAPSFEEADKLKQEGAFK